MINRINLILRAKNITARQFAEEIGIQPSGMSHILGGRNNPSLDFVTKVIRRYPEIDANWLLMGRGEMYAGGHAALPETDTSAPFAPVTESQPVAVPTLDETAKSEPTLFSSLADEPDPMPKAEEPTYRPTYVAVPPAEVQRTLSAASADVDERSSEPMQGPDTAESRFPAHLSGPRKIERMLLIYSDHTFEEYNPKG